MNYLLIDKMIKNALNEDIPNEDITTNSIIDKDLKSEIDLICTHNLSNFRTFVPTPNPQKGRME